MKLRHLVAALIVGAFVMTSAACSSDDSKDNGDKKSQESDKSDSGSDDSNDAEDATPTTVTDEEFTKQIGQLSSNIESAGKDVCKLVTAVQAEPPEPANPAQTKQFVDVWAQLLKAIGSTIGGDDEATLANIADKLVKVAADKGYPPNIFEDPDAAGVLSDEALRVPLDNFSNQAMACMGGTDAGDAGDAGDAATSDDAG